MVYIQYHHYHLYYTSYKLISIRTSHTTRTHLPQPLQLHLKILSSSHYVIKIIIKHFCFTEENCEDTPGATANYMADNTMAKRKKTFRQTIHNVDHKTKT
jgi:hypothetical protein